MRILLLTVVILLAVAWPDAPRIAHAEDVTSEYTKFVTWTFEKKPANNDKGTYTRDNRAQAGDNHVFPLAENTDKTQGDPPAWVVNDGLVGVLQVVGRAGGNGHPSAEGHYLFSASKPTEIPFGLFQLTASMFSRMKRELVPENPGNHKQQQAYVRIEGEVKIPSGTVTGAFVLDPTKPKEKVKAEPTTRPRLSGFAGYFDKDSYHDPVSIELREIETGITTVEQLFAFNSNALQGGECMWESSGITLDVPFDGSSLCAISGGFDSDWITSGPGTFAVSISNGTFSASGALSGLPWDVTYDGPHAVRAELPPQYVPVLEAEYAVPSSLVVDTNTYQETLMIGSSAEVQSSCCGPVGGAVELRTDSQPNAEATNSTTPTDHVAPAAAAAAAILIAMLGVQYARRRMRGRSTQ